MRKYLLMNKTKVVSACIMTIFAVIGGVYFSLIMKEIIDYISAGEFELLNRRIPYYIGYLILISIISFINRVFINNYLKSVIIKLKYDIFKSTMDQDFVNFQKKNIGEYISVYDNDVSMINDNYFFNWFEIISSISALTLNIIFALVLNVRMTLIVILASILLFSLPMMFSGYIGRLRENLLHSYGEFNSKLKDYLTGFETIKYHLSLNSILKRFKKTNEELEKRNVKYVISIATLDIIMGIISFAIIIIVLLVGSKYVISKELTVGGLIALIQILNGVTQSASELSSQLSKLASIKETVKKVEGLIVVNETHEIATGINNFKENISFNNVSFSYNGKDNILENLNLVLEKKKKYAVIGESGSGKSTIIRLLSKYYNDYSGEIKIDDVDVKDVSLINLYEVLSIVPQNIHLFNDTLRYNLSFDKDISELNISQFELQKLIDSNEQRLDMIIGENSTNISGGEKQRIGIARGFLRKTPIMILDESTSSMDNLTSRKIQEVLLNEPELTLVSVLHNLDSEILKKYDSIILIQNGAVKEMGTFEQCVKNNKELARMVGNIAYIPEP